MMMERGQLGRCPGGIRSSYGYERDICMSEVSMMRRALKTK